MNTYVKLSISLTIEDSKKDAFKSNWKKKYSVMDKIKKNYNTLVLKIVMGTVFLERILIMMNFKMKMSYLEILPIMNHFRKQLRVCTNI